MIQKKHIRIVGFIAAGAIGAACVGRWPNQSSYIQMGFYTVVVLGLLLTSFWSDRGRPNFWKGVGFTMLAHAAVLLAIRTLFPFKTILVVVPVALTELTMVATVFLNVLDY